MWFYKVHHVAQLDLPQQFPMLEVQGYYFVGLHNVLLCVSNYRLLNEVSLVMSFYKTGGKEECLTCVLSSLDRLMPSEWKLAVLIIDPNCLNKFVLCLSHYHVSQPDLPEQLPEWRNQGSCVFLYCLSLSQTHLSQQCHMWEGTRV